MVSDALFKRKKSLPMPNQNNLEHFLVIVSVIFYDNLQKIPRRAGTLQKLDSGLWTLDWTMDWTVD